MKQFLCARIVIYSPKSTSIHINPAGTRAGIVPTFGVNLTALVKKFQRICCRRSAEIGSAASSSIVCDVITMHRIVPKRLLRALLQERRMPYFPEASPL